MSEHEMFPDVYHGIYSRTVFGFWLFLLTDFVLFGALFASYAVLHKSTFGGATSKEIFIIPYYLLQKFLMLTCAFTMGIAGAAAHRKHRNPTLVFLLLTFVLGCLFMGIEITQLKDLIHTGNSWKRSAFLSAYFTLIGTHGIHVLFGLIWLILFIIPVWREGITWTEIRRITCLRMFWQFLSIVWVFIFSFVYYLGVAQ